MKNVFSATEETPEVGGAFNVALPNFSAPNTPAPNAEPPAVELRASQFEQLATRQAKSSSESTAANKGRRTRGGTQGEH